MSNSGCQTQGVKLRVSNSGLTLQAVRDAFAFTWVACTWRDADLTIKGDTVKTKLVSAVALALLFSLVPLAAHHSFEAEYDFNKPMKVSGTVTKMEWMNPHARFYVDVKDQSGKVTNWNFELGAIPVLLKQGWRRDSLETGGRGSHRRRLSGQGWH